MLRMQDVGELAYGGLVMGAQWLDSDRIKKGKLVATAIWKKYSTWTFLGIGLIATLMSAFGWMRRYESWAEHVSHGFIFYLPIFVKEMVSNTGTGTGRTGSASAVAEAQKILATRRQGPALNAGIPVNQTLQPEFEGKRIY